MQESIVEILQILAGLLNRRHFCEFSNNISASFAYFFLFVFGKNVLVEREDLIVEAFDSDTLRNIDQVARNSLTHVSFLIVAERADLVHNKVLAKLLAHVRCTFIQQLDC